MACLFDYFTRIILPISEVSTFICSKFIYFIHNENRNLLSSHNVNKTLRSNHISRCNTSEACHNRLKLSAHHRSLSIISSTYCTFSFLRIPVEHLTHNSVSCGNYSVKCLAIFRMWWIKLCFVSRFSHEGINFCSCSAKGYHL